MTALHWHGWVPHAGRSCQLTFVLLCPSGAQAACRSCLPKQKQKSIRTESCLCSEEKIRKMGGEEEVQRTCSPTRPPSPSQLSIRWRGLPLLYTAQHCGQSFSTFLPPPCLPLVSGSPSRGRAERERSTRQHFVAIHRRTGAGKRNSVTCFQMRRIGQ
ncbi:uncharacterized protein LY79DRAFT_56809 [Colletotrichum navitas]|uniref:Secreted protein n=1 Tax=Colletotrichum navitas TaxID=681940 RepID=A0AAD8UYR7_9PEZI|nr:uncharacterized protein LY79DRAFT_56809 [Colletotrichum navitas]KAK1569987.1 hypothetical protein LY79DRAFT_56809 [Colletotrichum navitas]